MFRYAVTALALAAALGGFTTGWNVRAWKAGADDQARTEQLQAATQEVRRFEQARAARVQETQDAKEAELRRVNDRLADALEQLRNRPERLPEPTRTSCRGATGAELSGRDAAFLARLAARADTLRAALAACQDREAPLRETP